MEHVKYLSISFLLVAVVLGSCGGDSGGGKSRSGGSGKDRGSAAMALGESQWQADSAKAKLMNGNLVITARNMDTTGGKVKSQDLTLNLADYKGPGDYLTGYSGSRFIGVGIDTDAMKATESDADKAAQAIKDGLSGAQHMMLSQAKVTITAANDTEVSGTFSWQPPAGAKQPAIQNGTFRALLAK